MIAETDPGAATSISYDLQAMPKGRVGQILKNSTLSVSRFSFSNFRDQCSLLGVVLFLLLSCRLDAFAVGIPTNILLERAGKRAAQLAEQFSEFTCAEAVTQMRLDQNGKVSWKRKSLFDSLVTMQLSGDELSVEESRLPQGTASKEKETAKSLLVTNGFSTMLLILHPHFQNSYEFSALSEEIVDGRHLQQILFEHIRGARSPSVLQLRGREYPLEWRGTLWIDQDSGSVVKVRVELKSSMEDIGLKRLSSEVQYLPVKFQEWNEPQWLPSVATIEAETPHQHWRNVHQFSQYRLFSVNTTVKTEEVQAETQ